MNWWERFTRSNFFIKLNSWEYWPFGIVHFPVILYYGWLSLRSRSFFFFSASNPGIPMGGMFGESKFEVLKKVPFPYAPKTVLMKQPSTTQQVMEALEQNGFHFPVIFKPDLGERGFMVKRIHDEKEVAQYLSHMRFDFLIQELVDMPLEFGVFYVRFPKDESGKVNSVVMKEMLTVTGDGTSTLQELIMKKDRAKLQWNSLQQTFRERLDVVVERGKEIELVPIGNHCLGTKFLNATHLINDRLSATFDDLSKKIDGFYFGRFDLRCATIEDLYAGNFKVMELNGCGAEPAHIYHPGFSVWEAIGVLFTHWRNIFLIARQNVHRGVSYIPYQQAKVYYRKFKLATTPEVDPQNI